LPLRLGLVGVGDVAQRDYLPEFGRLGDRVVVTVVCSRSAERARDVADRFGVARWTNSYADVVAATDVDAVVNLTPIQLHAEVTLAALAGGKHVYSEKPVAGTAAEVLQIRDAAAQAGCVVVTAPCVLLFPQVKRAREILSSGSLGPVHSARGSALGGVPPWEGYISDPSPFFSADAGPLVDMAVYPLHALTGLLGSARRVTALAQQTRDAFRIASGPYAGKEIDVGTADNWHLVLELDSGVLASVEANNCSAGSLAPELEIAGEVGTMAVSLLDVAEPVRVLADGKVTEQRVLHGRASGPDHLLGVEHLVDCIEGRTELTLSLDHAHHVLTVLEAARLSVSEGRTIDVGVRSGFVLPTAVARAS
jgi:predicted dehydrogenase